MLEHILMFNVSWIIILFKDEGIYLPTYLQCLNMWMLFMFSVCNLLSIPGKKKKNHRDYYTLIQDMFLLLYSLFSCNLSGFNWKDPLWTVPEVKHKFNWEPQSG